MRENLVVTSAYARTYVRTSVQILGEGEEIARCFWATSGAKRLFDSVESKV